MKNIRELFDSSDSETENYEEGNMDSKAPDDPLDVNDIDFLCVHEESLFFTPYLYLETIKVKEAPLSWGIFSHPDQIGGILPKDKIPGMQYIVRNPTEGSSICGPQFIRVCGIINLDKQLLLWINTDYVYLISME